jgi:predicted ferric reductase
MQKKQLGSIVIFLLCAGNIILWIASPPPDPTNHFNYIPQIAAEMFSSTAMILMSCAFILANKPRFLEPFFGGLDRMYVTHKNIALLAMIFLFGHFWIVPRSADLNVGRLLGMLAFTGIGGSILLALAPRLPLAGKYIRLAYHQWKFLHKFVGLFFIVGLIHITRVDNLAKDALANMYFHIISYIGATAYVYKELISPFVGKKPFVVEAVRKLNASTVEVTLKPQGSKPVYRAGQFLFISFEGDKILSEVHPFTISSAPSEYHLRVSIKASGDWTKYLYENLKPGTAAKVEVGYGMFDYKTGGQTQVWIAGGIGVTPFLSWVRDLNAEPAHDIHFFYSVRSDTDGLFWHEFSEASEKYKRFTATMNVSSRDGSLTAEKIIATGNLNPADVHVYLCGPLPMTEAFSQQFSAKGTPEDHIHFEEFNFR